MHFKSVSMKLSKRGATICFSLISNSCVHQTCFRNLAENYPAISCVSPMLERDRYAFQASVCSIELIAVKQRGRILFVLNW